MEVCNLPEPLTLPTEIDVSDPDASLEEAPGTVLRSVLVEKEMWTDARLKAMKEGRSISDVIRVFLKRWLDDEQPPISGME